jgi:hypothetical protein
LAACHPATAAMSVLVVEDELGMAIRYHLADS